MKTCIISLKSPFDFEKSTAVNIEVNSYELFCEMFLFSLKQALDDNSKWCLVAILAEQYLQLASRIRSYQGYSKLFLADSELLDPSMTVRDGVFSPKPGQEFLYGLISGPSSLALQVVKLGMYDQAAVLFCTRQIPSDESIVNALESALVLKSQGGSEKISWNHCALFRSLPNTLFVAGLDDLSIGSTLRFVLCAEEPIGLNILRKMA